MNISAQRSTKFTISIIYITILTFMIFLYLKAKGTDPARYNDTEAILHQMKTTDTLIERDAFELRRGLEKNYDTINDHMTALMQNRYQLNSNIETLNKSFGKSSQISLNDMDSKISEKLERVERFKSANAILNNSRYYFPTICDFVQKNYAKSITYPGIAQDVDTLLDGILAFYMLGDASLKAASLARIHKMQNMEMLLDPQARKDVQGLLMHARMLVKSKQEVDNDLADLIAISTSQTYDHYLSQLEMRREEDYRASNYYRIGLLLLGTGFVFYGIFAFLRVRRQSNELMNLNATLENRVESRTKSLQTANEDLLLNEQRFRAIFTHASIGIVQFSPRLTMLKVNPAICTMLAIDEENLFRSTIFSLMCPQEESNLRNYLSSLLHTSPGAADTDQLMEIKFTREDHSERLAQIRVSLVRSDEGIPQFFILLVQDVTSQKAAEDIIEKLAFQDSLTGLPNRAAFMIQLKEMLKKAKTNSQRMAMLFIDFDNFKQINDTLGHDAGDEFLKQRASRLKSALRENDFLARLGGDEFTILLPNLFSEQIAQDISKRLLDIISEPMYIDGQEIFGGASIGITFNSGKKSLRKICCVRPIRLCTRSKTLVKGASSYLINR